MQQFTSEMLNNCIQAAAFQLGTAAASTMLPSCTSELHSFPQHTYLHDCTSGSLFGQHNVTDTTRR